MPFARIRTFKSGDDEVIRLPEDVAFGEDTELVVISAGDVMTIYPAAASMPMMIRRLRSLSMPPSVEQKGNEELPERL